ncbi:hypothetical protein T492DRAFT_838436 [Pavlovales sp. CCMP2436]|nr:hypothetical protein T492DRAFT_838436 [Pavlovales sp. CCMP2436]
MHFSTGGAHSRRRRAEAVWPTSASRLAHGLELAAATLLASAKVAYSRSWTPVPGRTAVTALRVPGAGGRKGKGKEGGGEERGKEGKEGGKVAQHELPVVNFDDQLFMPLLPLLAEEEEMRC